MNPTTRMLAFVGLVGVLTAFFGGSSPSLLLIGWTLAAVAGGGYGIVKAKERSI